MQPDQELQQQAKTWLALSIVSSVFCLSLGLGIGGAIFCYLAQQAAAQGLRDDAQAKLKWGKILTVVGSALGVLTAILTLIFR
ncbi:MAG TPA: hypothetical protein VEQ58_03325 [Polyangiaceae bacterium]|nr:hypothetical protein [Polyangiaceae bacterium]